jgi:hypothetical protein
VRRVRFVNACGSSSPRSHRKLVHTLPGARGDGAGDEGCQASDREQFDPGF